MKLERDDAASARSDEDVRDDSERPPTKPKRYIYIRSIYNEANTFVEITPAMH